MFVKAVEEVSHYTRPIHTIMRSYGSNKVFPGASTLFFVNEDGDAVTCRHVAELLLKAEQINQQYLLFDNCIESWKIQETDNLTCTLFYLV